ncbi:carbonyl reductase [NADPH] 3-like [Clytia hemisphaerica]|uniref:Carbonyl reductase n=1 Tax=Clytia hemisphaerica TaxID=252671 RepID=A0A7M6DQS4_9CNID
MSSSPRVFVVTGANKGIGKSIVKLFLQDKEEKIVYLTARNEELGLQTVKEFEQNGLKPRFRQLDITDQNSIDRLRDHLQKEHHGIDVLVNNAGIAYSNASTIPFGEQADTTTKCNFFGTLSVCEALFPLLRRNARVVHVSSGAGTRGYEALSAEMKGKFSDPNLPIQDLKDLINVFVQAARDNQVTEKGFKQNAYGISKLGQIVLASIQQRQFDSNKPEQNILVNSCTPGFVDTDMTQHMIANNKKTVDEGADTPVYLALLSPDVKEPRGKFLRSREVEAFPPTN